MSRLIYLRLTESEFKYLRIILTGSYEEKANVEDVSSREEMGIVRKLEQLWKELIE